MEFALEPDAPRGLPNALSRKLEQWTHERWVISVSDEGGARPVADQNRAKRQSLFKEVRELPDVKAVLEKFPGAEIVDVTELAPAMPESANEDEDANPGASGTE